MSSVAGYTNILRSKINEDAKIGIIGIRGS